MANKDTPQVNVLDLLDQNFADLVDLPQFKVPDTGMYDLSVKLEGKIVNKKPAVEALFTIRQLLELDNPEEVPEEERAKPDDKFSMLFILRNEDGTKNEISEGRMKEFLAPFHQHFEVDNVKTLITEHMHEGVEITAKVVKKERRDDAEKFDARVSDISIK